jgi:uncharacterized protein (TIGR02996 family)
MSDRTALLRAIIDNLEEDTPRLIFADWLQEHSCAARAEFIRVQCEVSRGGGSSGALARECELLRTAGNKAGGALHTNPKRQRGNDFTLADASG